MAKSHTDCIVVHTDVTLLGKKSSKGIVETEKHSDEGKTVEVIVVHYKSLHETKK